MHQDPKKHFAAAEELVWCYQRGEIKSQGQHEFKQSHAGLL
jgi:hypothetical protein